MSASGYKKTSRFERPMGSCRGGAALASCATREAAPSLRTLPSPGREQEVRVGRLHEGEPEGRRRRPGAQLRARRKDRGADGARATRARALRRQLSAAGAELPAADRKSPRLNSSHLVISYAD